MVKRLGDIITLSFDSLRCLYLMHKLRSVTAKLIVKQEYFFIDIAQTLSIKINDFLKFDLKLFPQNNKKLVFLS